MSKAKALLAQLDTTSDNSLSVISKGQANVVQQPVLTAEIIDNDAPKRWNWKKIGLIFGGVVILQAVLPHQIKPITLAASPFVAFYTEMVAVNERSVEAQALAKHRAQVEINRNNAKANCGILGLFSSGLGDACGGLVDDYHDNKHVK